MKSSGSNINNEIFLIYSIAKKKKKNLKIDLYAYISDEEEWEKNLAAEDFEVVDDQNVDESELDLDLK